MSWERIRLLVRSFGLGTDDAGVFSRTQWRFPWVIWAICRIVAAVYYTIAMSSTFIFLLATDPMSAATALVFVTDWTCILVTVYFLLATVNLFLDRKHGRYYHYSDRESLPAVELSWRHRVQWCLMNIYMNFSIIVTVVYWSFLRMPLPIIFDLTCHTFPSILGIVEVLLTPIPVRIQHVIYVWIYGGIYVTFTLIFYAANGESPFTGSSEIYPNILDWAKPRMTIKAMVVVVLAIFGCQLFLWVLYKCRVYVARRFMYSAIPLASDAYLHGSEEQNGNIPGDAPVTASQQKGAEKEEVEEEVLMLNSAVKSSENQEV
ncbi:protein rolling stone-like [Amphiura filiformis]|uniref:protein rolling stone-like n=1 Tax=Amphiura filiformis TaxID=82378 RepID=UPI003B21674A